MTQCDPGTATADSGRAIFKWVGVFLALPAASYLNGATFMGDG